MSDIQNLDFCNETLIVKEQIEYRFLELGERLLKIRDNSLFSPQWTSFSEYVEEMKMSEAQASKLINIFQKFVLFFPVQKERLLKAGGWSNLAEGLPLVKDQATAEEVVSQAEILSRQDFRIWKKERLTGVSQSDCQHEDTYLLKVCRSCGDKESILLSECEKN